MSFLRNVLTSHCNNERDNLFFYLQAGMLQRWMKKVGKQQNIRESIPVPDKKNNIDVSSRTGSLFAIVIL